jgi:hypothetical protein
MDDLGTAMDAATWGQDVLAALRRYFESERLRDPMVRLVAASLGVTDDGSPAVIAVYDHPWYDRRVGRRSRLDQPPLSIYKGMTAAESLAHDIAEYEIAEPLGTYYESLAEDDSGVWWWQSPMQE